MRLGAPSEKGEAVVPYGDPERVEEQQRITQILPIKIKGGEIVQVKAHREAQAQA